MNPCPLDAVDVALDDAAQAPLWVLTPTERVDRAARIATIVARAQALLGMAMLAVHQSDLSQVVGRSAAIAVANETKGPTRDLNRSLRLYEWLTGFGLFEQAALDGRLSQAHVQALKGVDNERTRPHLTDAQDYLIEAAVSCDWKEFEQVLRYFELAFDPDGNEPDRQYSNRSLSMHKNRDGTVSGRFYLDPVSGAALTNAIEHHVQRLLEEDKASGNERTPTQRKADALVELIMRGADTGATFPQPLVHIVLGAVTAADGLTRLDPDGPHCDHTDPPCNHDRPHATDPARAGTNSTGTPPQPDDAGASDEDEASEADDPRHADPPQATPTPTATAHDSSPDTDDSPEPPGDTEPGEGEELPFPDDEDDDQAIANWLWNGNPPPPLQPGPARWRPPDRRNSLLPLPGRLPIDPFDLEQRSELANGTPIHPKLAIAALANATLRRLVLGPDGEILDLGRARRSFPNYVKQALLTAGRGRCAVPACDSLAAWLQCDHVWPWNRGGNTSVKNAQLLCGRHNKIKTDSPPTNLNGKPSQA